MSLGSTSKEKTAAQRLLMPGDSFLRRAKLCTNTTDSLALCMQALLGINKHNLHYTEYDGVLENEVERGNTMLWIVNLSLRRGLVYAHTYSSFWTLSQSFCHCWHKIPDTQNLEEVLEGSGCGWRTTGMTWRKGLLTAGQSGSREKLGRGRGSSRSHSQWLTSNQALVPHCTVDHITG